ncbi:hypothetical protein ACB092_02G181400 [Castanea dentata]
MGPIAFHHLCHILTEGEHIRPTTHMSVMEQVLIFLHIINHNVKFHVISSRFHRSTETVHRYFNVILRGVLKLYRALIRLPSEDKPLEIRDSRRFYPNFKVNIATSPMHTTMLTVLSEEAAKGNKPSNTFKPGSFATVAKAISEHFGVECHPSYIENRMRTLRTMWTTIQTLRKKKMYDELAIVVGKDLATGSFAKSYSTEMVADNGEDGVVDKGKNVVELSTTGSTISKSHKRGRAPPSDDSILTDLSNQLKEIAVALKKINRGPVDFNSLYSEVMAMVADEYSEDMLATAFDHLCENKKPARGFLAKNAKLRKLWMDSYLFTRL